MLLNGIVITFGDWGQENSRSTGCFLPVAMLSSFHWQGLCGGGVWGGSASPRFPSFSCIAGKAGNTREKDDSWRAYSPPNRSAELATKPPCAGGRIARVSDMSCAIALAHAPPPLMCEPFFLEQPHLKEFDIQAALGLPKEAMDLLVARIIEDTAVEAA